MNFINKFSSKRIVFFFGIILFGVYSIANQSSESQKEEIKINPFVTQECKQTRETAKQIADSNLDYARQANTLQRELMDINFKELFTNKTITTEEYEKYLLYAKKDPAISIERAEDFKNLVDGLIEDEVIISTFYPDVISLGEKAAFGSLDSSKYIVANPQCFYASDIRNAKSSINILRPENHAWADEKDGLGLYPKINQGIERWVKE